MSDGWIFRPDALPEVKITVVKTEHATIAIGGCARLYLSITGNVNASEPVPYAWTCLTEDQAIAVSEALRAAVVPKTTPSDPLSEKEIAAIMAACKPSLHRGASDASHGAHYERGFEVLRRAIGADDAAYFVSIVQARAVADTTPRLLQEVRRLQTENADLREQIDEWRQAALERGERD
jgi:hypothetical protein